VLDMEAWHLNYSLKYNQELLEEQLELLSKAREQLKRHYGELNIRSKAWSARLYIDYLEKNFIPDTEETIEAIRQMIEINKLQLTGLSYEEAHAQLNKGGQQIELFW